MAKETKKGSDIAKNTILVLLIFTIVLSAISTWIVLDALNNVKQSYLWSAKNQPGVTQGRISVGIMNPDAQTAEPQVNKGGQVRLGVISP